MRLLCAATAVVLGSCAAPPELAVSPAGACTIRGGFASLSTREAIAALRQEVESGPLFLIPAARAHDVRCQIEVDTGAVWLEYAFADDEWLRVEHDPRTAYTSRDAQFVLPSGEDPVAVLQQVEAATFGAEGCGIAWDEPERRMGGDSTSEHVFRGTRCHCQARIRHDGAGRPHGFLFRHGC